jgi:MFS family permease
LCPRHTPFCVHEKAAFVEAPVAREFYVSKEVAILGVSLFVLGLGFGPLVAGPMSEIYGRKVVYRASFSLFFLFMFPVAFAPNICKWLWLALIPTFPAARVHCNFGATQMYTWFFASSLDTAALRFSA